MAARVGSAAGDVTEILRDVHTRVCACLRDADLDTELSAHRNAKGDVQRRFDVRADTIIRAVLEQRFGSGVVLSEESEAVRFGEQEPAYRFIVDPVDGSDNRARRLPLSAVSVAVLPVDGPIRPDRLYWAMVGGLHETIALTATRGAGAHCGARPLCTSGVREVSAAFLSCELNHFGPGLPVACLLQKARAVRSYGCASRAITLVATGALDVHIDVRGRLTPESFLAAQLILEEAGGCVLDLDGQPLGAMDSLLCRTSLVAAATPELAHEVLDVLAG